jgi:hypothetical protein
MLQVVAMVFTRFQQWNKINRLLQLTIFAGAPVDANESRLFFFEI